MEENDRLCTAGAGAPRTAESPTARSLNTHRALPIRESPCENKASAYTIAEIVDDDDPSAPKGDRRDFVAFDKNSSVLLAFLLHFIRRESLASAKVYRRFRETLIPLLAATQRKSRSRNAPRLNHGFVYLQLHYGQSVVHECTDYARIEGIISKHVNHEIQFFTYFFFSRGLRDEFVVAILN